MTASDIASALIGCYLLGALFLASGLVLTALVKGVWPGWREAFAYLNWAALMVLVAAIAVGHA